MVKEKTEPINVRVTLKRFFETQKTTLKDSEGKFLGLSEVLLYYLSDNPKFVKDFTEYNAKTDTKKEEIDVIL